MKSDNPPVNLHSFIRGSNEGVIKFIVTEEHFPVVHAAVTDILESREPKRGALEARMERPSDYAKSIKAVCGISDHRFSSALHVGL